MKLALCAYLRGSGGAERQITMLANAMAERGHEVHFLVLSEYNKKYEISPLVHVHDLTEEEKKAFHPIIGRYKALKRAYKKIKPDCTIHYNLQSAYLTAAMPKKIYCKSIYSERGDPYDKEYDGLLGFVRSWCVKRMDGFMFQSEGARDFFKLRKGQKSIVIHNSIDISADKYPIADKRDNRIVTVGRLTPQKNPHLLIDAFADIVDDYPEITLDFYGDGELREELEEKIKTLGLCDRINLYYSRSDIFDCIRTARIFVLPSDFEGMPNALMEAMALGIPSISADCRPGGARTLIQDGINGYIVPVRDKTAMAKKIAYLLNNEDIAENIAANARDIINTHSCTAIFDKWNDYLKTFSTK